MKTKMNIKKTIAMATLSITIMACGSCGNTQTNSTNEESSAIEKKINIPSTDIHTAAFLGNLNAIEQHIAAGTDLNKKDQYGSTPLIIASTFGRTKVAIALIEGGADLTATSKDGSTPLHTAAFFCRTEIVKSLLANGADKTLKNMYGSTPMDNVSGPFKEMKPIYDEVAKQLGPLGLKLDFERIEQTRPEIAQMLK